MRGNEVQAAGDLTGDALGGFGGMIQGTHAAVADRVFGALGQMGAPVRVVHDGISHAIYTGVANGLRLTAKAGAAAIAAGRPGDAQPLSATGGGRLALAALNGAVGDILGERYAPLALDMTAHAHAVPTATPRVVVFLHGLGENGDSWRLGGGTTYGERLARDHGMTPVYVTYNSGLHISDNGRRLAALLDDVIDGWPVRVDDLVVVGHSMGGLVARSACHYGERDGRAWTDKLRSVFCLGTPHLGAPLERAANVAGWALGRVPETRPFAKVVNGRSVGIKDLRFGACVEDDWSGCDPDEFLKDRCTEVPFLASADYYFIGATLGRREGDVIDRLVGDLLVLYTSASGVGKKRRIGFEVDRGKRLDGVNHFQLLNHPLVYEQLRDWIAATPRLELATSDPAT